MLLKRIFLIITLLISLSFAAQRPGATFLLIPPTAKATGMAYAWTAICNDASANYYNAAGLALLKSPMITLTYFKYLPLLHSDMYYTYLGLVYPLYKSAWGLDFIHFTPGLVEVTDFQGHYLGQYVAWRLASKINYARKITNNFSLGISLKFIYQKYGFWYFWNDPYLIGIGLDRGGTGMSWAFDFNLLYKILPNLFLGSVLHNFGPNIAYTEVEISDPLPLTYRLGLAYKPIEIKDFSATISAEIQKILVGMFANEENSFCENLKYELKEAWKGVGLELTVYKILSLRTGYFYDYKVEREGPTFGFGVNIKGLEIDIGIDEQIYDFDTQNRKISLSYTF